MCGIVGILAPRPDPSLAPTARRMLSTLAHRGPDGEGLVAFRDGLVVDESEPADLVLGHRRLAILDLSAAGAQPMADPRRRHWLSYNGEVYDFVEHREALERAGEAFDTRTDTEVLLRLLARRGVEALPEVDGMFALLWHDTERRELWLVRDRFGIKPLYTWRSPDGALVIASEIKAFTAHPEWSPRARRQGVWDFLVRGIVDHSRDTMFEGVAQVPAGHWARVDTRDVARTIEWRRWYRPGERGPAELDDPPARYLEALDGAVGRRLRADVPVGSCLSGGLDSSTIVALLARRLVQEPGAPRPKTFTARSEVEALDEWRYARETAALAGADAMQVWPTAAGMWERLDELVWTQDEPFGSPSIWLQHEVFRAAREQGVVVMLDGQGADEQLAGYHTFFKVAFLEHLRKGRWSDCRRLVRDLRSMHGYGRGAVLRKLAIALAPRALAVPLSRFGGDCRRLARVVDVRRPGVEPIDPIARGTGRSGDVRAFSIEQLESHSLPSLLHWEDRNSMAWSVEARVPFLAHEAVELALGLPLEWKLDGGRTKRVLRDATRGLLPESVRGRIDKVAFTPPTESWVRRSDTTRASQALERGIEALQPWLRPGGAEELRSLLDPSTPWDALVWRVICLGAWTHRFGVLL